nr:MAG TPA: membrane protein [Bacteriophage sp.]
MTKVTKPLWIYKNWMISISLTVIWFSILFRAITIIEI